MARIFRPAATLFADCRIEEEGFPGYHGNLSPVSHPTVARCNGASLKSRNPGARAEDMQGQGAGWIFPIPFGPMREKDLPVPDVQIGDVQDGDSPLLAWRSLISRIGPAEIHLGLCFCWIWVRRALTMKASSSRMIPRAMATFEVSFARFHDRGGCQNPGVIP